MLLHNTYHTSSCSLHTLLEEYVPTRDSTCHIALGRYSYAAVRFVRQALHRFLLPPPKEERA